jgi:hypothetical protein
MLELVHGAGQCGLCPSIVKKPGTLLPLPIAFNAAASAGVMVPNTGRPVVAGAFTGATRRSWIIQPSYQPLSLLMTNKPEMSVKMSMKASTSSGSVGKPGFGSTTSRTAPRVGSPQSNPVAVNCA